MGGSKNTLTTKEASRSKAGAATRGRLTSGVATPSLDYALAESSDWRECRNGANIERPVLFLENMSADSNQAIELLTISEVAGLLRISASSVRRLQQSRRLPFIKVGGSVRFTRGDIASYVEKQRVEAVDQ